MQDLNELMASMDQTPSGQRQLGSGFRGLNPTGPSTQQTAPPSMGPGPAYQQKPRGFGQLQPNPQAPDHTMMQKLLMMLHSAMGNPDDSGRQAILGVR